MTTIRQAASHLPTHLYLGVVAFLSVFPFYWMIVGATNRSSDIILGKLTFGSYLFQNVASLWGQFDVPRVVGNSFIVASSGTVLTLIIASLAGYGFEMFRTRISDRIFGALLLLLSIPFAALMIPLFLMVSRLGLIDSLAGVVLPTVASIFVIFYFRQATRSFPRELRDAARIDGLREWQIFLFVYAPSMRSTYAAATIIVFTANWNNYLWPLIVLQSSDKMVLTLAISSINSGYTPDYGAVMIAVILTTLPTLIIFFLLQRLFVEGLLGSVK